MGSCDATEQDVFNYLLTKSLQSGPLENMLLARPLHDVGDGSNGDHGGRSGKKRYVDRAGRASNRADSIERIKDVSAPVTLEHTVPDIVRKGENLVGRVIRALGGAFKSPGPGFHLRARPAWVYR